jgi:hypothetical protein
MLQQGKKYLEKIFVKDISIWDLDGLRLDNIQSFIQSLNIPESYEDSDWEDLRFDVESDWDGGSNLRIFGSRLETTEEYSHRIAHEKKQEAEKLARAAKRRAVQERAKLKKTRTRKSVVRITT